MGSLPDGTNGPHVFVDNLQAPELSDEDRHHLQRVLRLKSGDPLTVGDGVNQWRPAIFGTSIETTGEVVAVPPPSIPITIGFVVPKGDRPSWIVQKLTELGVDEIHLLSSQRSVVKWNPTKAEQQHQRLTRIAREAAMQSRQVRVPQIKPISEIKHVTTKPALALAHRNGDRITLKQSTIYIGPEGGWDPTEVADRRTISLGPSVLRAETAAVTAASALSLLREDLLDNHSP
ncbi:MAG TPA: RsmE family RNA methyltransferase [Acidimicrobiales bacterium]|nr:RsmE family RNA methyltransferase [Acidimicrobiales bacterium]